MPVLPFHCSFLCAVTLAGAALAPAQTFIVDAAGGPGSHFTDLPAAIAAVPDGAVLDVRQGGYSAFTIANKSLSIVGNSITVGGASTVGPLGAHQTVEMQGVLFQTGTLTLSACAGPVVLRTVRTAHMATTSFVVADCAHVQAQFCTFGGMQLTRSLLSQVYGSIVRVGGTTPLIDVQDSRLQLTQVNVVKISSQAPTVMVANADVRMAHGLITYTGGTNVVSGTGTCRVYAVGGMPLTPGPGVSLDTSAATATTVGGGALGGTAEVAVRGPAGDLGVMLGGLPTLPFPVLGLRDPMFLQPGTEVVLGIGTLGASPIQASVAIPATPALRGTRLCWQAVSLGPNYRVQLSNPAISTAW